MNNSGNPPYGHPALWPPHYYSHFTLARAKAQPVILFFLKNPFNTATQLIWTVFFVARW